MELLPFINAYAAYMYTHLTTFCQFSKPWRNVSSTISRISDLETTLLCRKYREKGGENG